jgi:long-chain acyl-CoA synthetase
MIPSKNLAACGKPRLGTGTKTTPRPGIGQTQTTQSAFGCIASGIPSQYIARSMASPTVNELFYRVVERNSERLMMHREPSGWIPLSSRELYRDTTGVARALLDWKIAKGDRVAILSENRPAWAIADFACLLIGAVVVPLYPTLTGDQIAHMLRDSGTRAIFVSTQQQLEKILAIRAQTPLEHVVLMDPQDACPVVQMQDLMLSGPESRDANLDSLARGIGPEDLATLLYTSGTTGVPKGVMLTHGNLAANFLCSLNAFPFPEDATSVSFLPLSHITARHVDHALLHEGVTLAYCPIMEDLPRALLETKPSIFVAVPRVYEKIRMQAERTAQGFAKRHILDWALNVGREHRGEILAGQRPTAWSWHMADRIVFSKIVEGVGGRVHTFISGGAPLGRELAEWFADAGIRIHEGYGLTETSPVIAVNTPQAHRLGSVGKPLPNVEVRIAEDGEILVKGPSVFRGYWNNPKETADSFVDGFFKTGDIGKLDSDGFLWVTDRKKDLIKTSGGKFIAPQLIEASLKSNALIAEAVVIGDKRKFPAVLILPYFPLLEDWAGMNQVSFGSRKDLVAEPRVQALYEGIVEEVNAKLARFEKMKKTLVLADEFSVAEGTLTPTLKMRRRAVEDRHRAEIDSMYAAADQSLSD